MTEDNAKPARRSPLWLRLLLFGSLAVNLLIAGLVLGAMSFRGDDDRRHLRGARDIAPIPFIFAMEQEDRRAVIDRFRAASRDHRPSRGETRERLGMFLETLRAEEFDVATVEALLEGERSRGRARQEAGQAVMVEYFQSLTTDERRAYADRLERILTRRDRSSDRADR